MTPEQRRIITLVSAAYFLAESGSSLEDALDEAVDACLLEVQVPGHELAAARVDVDGRGLELAARMRQELADLGKAGKL